MARSAASFNSSNRASSSSTRRSSSGSSAGSRRSPGVAPPAPGPRESADDDGADRERAERQQPGEEIEPALGRLGEHGGAELVDELGLDLRGAVTGRDLRADERLHPRRDRRVRLVERRLARRADDLRLEIGLPRRSPPRPAPASASASAQRRPRAARVTARASASRDALGVGLPVALGVDASLDPLTDESARAIDEERLRESRHAPLAERRAVAVVDDRVGEAVALREALRVQAEVLGIDARGRRGPATCTARRSSGAPAPRPCTGCTTTPRS